MSHIVFDSLRRINSPIENGVFFLTLHGSRAYGTNVEGSDEDFKGFGVPTKNTYFSPFEKIHFEQQEIKNPDTVIYEIRKFFSLLSNLNPNCIEVLFTREEDHIFMSKEGREVLDNRELFLSKRCRWSFSGYAFSQLKHLKTHRDYLLSPMKVPPTRADFGLGEKPEIEKNQLDATMALIQKEVDRINFDFLDYLQEPEKIALRSVMSEMLATFKITSKDRWMSVARSLGFGDNFILLLQKEKEYMAKKRKWEQYLSWKEKRNPKRAADEEKFGYDPKFAYHLIRLQRMCEEILTEGKVNVWREDREELLDIRNGRWKYDDLIDYSEKKNEKIAELYKACTILPATADTKKIEALCVKLIEQRLAA